MLKMSVAVDVVLLVLLVTGSSISKKLPADITLCHRHDPALNQCVRNAVELLQPRLINGIPELQLPPLNPLILPQAGLNSGDNFRASFKNIEVYHIEEFKIEHLDLNLDKLHIELGLSFKRLRIKSQYNIDGRLLILQLQGQGQADGNFTDVFADAVFEGKLQRKKGKDHLTLASTKLNLKLGKPVFQFDNIFRDNKELNDRTNKIINENIVDILDELKPVIDKTIIEFAFGIVSRVFNRFSLEELFPN